MRKNHPHICLYKPEIPQNTGNIARLSAATCSRLHLVRPFGFSTDDKNLRRPGLDYWPYVDMEIHESFSLLEGKYGANMAFFTKFATKSYTELEDHHNFFVFGQETKGLPDELHAKYAQQLYRIPMFHSGVRSLNLSNSVSIVVYHYLATRNFFQTEEP